jgi:transcriptional regulator with GAF, ATPase, and Fis domain
MDRLMRYAWPGNIRELENVIERATILAKGSVLRIDDAFLHPDPAPRILSDGTMEEVERAYVFRVLQEVGWVIEGKQGAAVRLALHPNTLRSRMQRLGIKKPRPTV